MVELRKRKAPPPPPFPAKKKAAPGTGRKPGRPKAAEPAKPPAEDAKKKADDKPAKTEKDAAAPAAEKAAADAPAAAPATGAVVELDGFGGEFETHEGKKTTLKQLVDESKAGVVLFTYPKANTPGCKS
jgi:thioredoxin-dependent peroxiredoxin